jgi:hypothetical protein
MFCEPCDSAEVSKVLPSFHAAPGCDSDTREYIYIMSQQLDTRSENVFEHSHKQRVPGQWKASKRTPSQPRYSSVYLLFRMQLTRTAVGGQGEGGGGSGRVTVFIKMNPSQSVIHGVNSLTNFSLRHCSEVFKNPPDNLELQRNREPHRPPVLAFNFTFSIDRNFWENVFANRDMRISSQLEHCISLDGIDGVSA